MSDRQRPSPELTHLSLDRALVDLDQLSGAGRDELVDRITSLLQLVEQVEWAMVGRAPIEQAKGVLMAAHRIDADTAFEMLRTQSQVTNTKLALVARAVLRAHTGETAP